ncbi:hypothetical protein M7I_5957 [Glarea lozoyensis 74030]|uniref:Uncharacterized protein n=1 Tax=Glarea lozoyensis (strain ATCC 74030 / MF5533) TaxID=1104152 RepID=H0ET98_GLAL7|nr:hypothetical protein M7I_5957 [Glarea lozoyensis 74030]
MALSKADYNRNYDFAATNIDGLPVIIRYEVRYQGPNNYRVHGKGPETLKGKRRIEAGSCILKFRVENCWASVTNGRFKVTSEGVGHDHVEVEFETEQWRGADWGLHAWYGEGLAYARI